MISFESALWFTLGALLVGCLIGLASGAGVALWVRLASKGEEDKHD